MANEPYTYENEEWRDIPGWDGYQASDLGRIRSLDRVHMQRQSGTLAEVKYPGHIRSQSECPQTGYRKVGLYIRGKDKRRTLAVHVLVCSAFHGPRPDGCCVAHNNGIRSDNRATNLRWATQAENRADCLLHGTNNHGSRNGQAKLTEEDVIEMRRLKRLGVTAIELADMFGISWGHVHDCVSGKRWSHI